MLHNMIGLGWGGALITVQASWCGCWCVALITFQASWYGCWCSEPGWAGLGRGADLIPSKLIWLLMLHNTVGVAGVGHPSHSRQVDMVVDVLRTRLGLAGWGTDPVPGKLIWLLMLRTRMDLAGLGRSSRSRQVDMVVDVLRTRLGLGGVGRWSRSKQVDMVVDAPNRVVLGWGGALITFHASWYGCWCSTTRWAWLGWDMVVDAPNQVRLGWGRALITFRASWYGCWCSEPGWAGLGRGADLIPSKLIRLLMLHNTLGLSVVGHWSRSKQVDMAVDAPNQVGLAWVSRGKLPKRICSDFKTFLGKVPQNSSPAEVP